MNAKKAKQLRKLAFTDQFGNSSRPKDRQYSVIRKIKKFFTGKTDKEGKQETVKIGRDTLMCSGLRRRYKDIKKGIYREMEEKVRS